MGDCSFGGASTSPSLLALLLIRSPVRMMFVLCRCSLSHNRRTEPCADCAYLYTSILCASVSAVGCTAVRRASMTACSGRFDSRNSTCLRGGQSLSLESAARKEGSHDAACESAAREQLLRYCAERSSLATLARRNSHGGLILSEFPPSLVGTFKELAEGRLDPEAWLAWWGAHVGEVEAACSRGAFLRVKPTHLDSAPSRSALISQQGVCTLLDSLGVAYVRSDRYQQQWDADFERFVADQKAKKKALAEKFKPSIAALGAHFPAFARMLTKRAEAIDRFEEPATAQEIDAVEAAIGVPLPAALRQFFGCTKALELEGFSLGLTQVFSHPAPIKTGSDSAAAICIAEYWLESDGDQVLIKHEPQSATDPAVYYYAHSQAGATKKLADSFTAWLEKLPRSPVFRD